MLKQVIRELSISGELKCGKCGQIGDLETYEQFDITKASIDSNLKPIFEVSCKECIKNENKVKYIDNLIKSRKPDIVKKCEACDSEFVTNYSKKRFCSTKCRQRESNKRNKAYIRKYFQDNKSKIYKQGKISREKIRKFIKDYKAQNPCVDCGISNVEVLEFDHVRGKKLFTISEVATQIPQRLLEEEIVKCVVVCANCHRIRESKRRQDK